MSDFRDFYSRITSKIITDLEQGVRPWMRPWSAEHAAGRIARPLRYNGIPYKGINVVMLWSASVVNGYACPLWLTFRQAQELGGNVRKGEHGELVVYANRIIRTETDAKGEETERNIPFLKGYTVFNAEQCDGLPAHFTAKAEAPALSPVQRCDAADRFFAVTGADIRHGGTRAFYAEGPDYVQMPPFETFRDAESYAATLAHELTHWTKHDKRLARDMGRVKWGDEGYAREELVAELGAAFLCADLAITPEVREDHAAYIASWLKALQDDKRLIFAASAHAQRAADYLHSLQPGQASTDSNTDSEEGRAAAWVALFPPLPRPPDPWRQAMFLNHYRCPRCDHAWSDEWSCMVDDECPECGCRDVSPVESEDIDSDYDDGDDDPE